ncbi:MAG: hypothetical protein ABW128_17320 [Rhizorhabdus sp.]
MKKAWMPALIVASAGAAAAATLGLSAGANVGADASGIAVVNGVARVSAGPSFAATTPEPAACTRLAASAGSADPLPGTTGCGFPSHVTLQDRVWFGAYWQLLRTPITLGGGYANARIDRSSDGDFFDGIVDKVDATGRVTDVIIAFAGAQGGPDAVQGESILAGIPLDEAARATTLYEQLLNDPRYADARIHVTGHSLGTGYAEYVLAYALAKHGAAATDARADFLGFGAPNWLASAAAHFGVDPVLAAARMADFTAANDPVLVNGVVRIGINTYLPAFAGLPGVGAALDVIAAHYPTTYAAALGLPDWLSDADKAAATAALSAQFQTGNSIAPGYGPAGRLPFTVDGSAGAEWIEGLSGGDRLVGHRGADLLTGGTGADTFVYLTRNDSGVTPATEDWITDFSRAEGDRIDLSALSPLRPLAFVGTATFSGAGQVRFRYDGGATLVEVNVAGGATADMVIRLSGRISLTASDFGLSVA